MQMNKKAIHALPASQKRRTSNKMTKKPSAPAAGLTANAIKLIAIVAMTLDHITWLLFPGYTTAPLPLCLHILGRITCPVMCYFVAEGYHYTRDVSKYTRRLFLFALLSHCPYVLSSFACAKFVDWRSFIPFYYGDILNQTSVIWSLAWGLVMLRVVNSQKLPDAAKPLLVVLICPIALPSDWSCIAALCVLAFGTNRCNFKKQMQWMLFYVALYAAVYFFAIDKVYGLMQIAVVLAVPILRLYNGRRGKNAACNRFMKWFFYLYYPLHLTVIGLLRYAAA